MESDDEEAPEAPAGRIPMREDDVRRVFTLASALILAALIIGVRVLLGTTAEHPVLILLVVPVALIAAEFGVAGGLIAAAWATAVSVLAATLDFSSSGWLEVTTRTYIFITTGALVGHLTSSLRRARESELDALVEAAAARKADERLRRHSAEVAALADAASELVRSNTADESRSSICEAMHRAVGAQFVILFEPNEEQNALIATASRGIHVKGLERSMASRSFGAVRCYSRAEPVFVPDLSDRPGIAPPELEQSGARSVLWQPASINEQIVGVIALGWLEAMPELPERIDSMAGTLSVEAAIAIQRAHNLEHLERMARTDELTGLANRRSWDEELSRELSRAQRERRPVCVAVLDLDAFKDYNDRHGHQAGDRLLKEAAGAWRGELREHDTLARYGGDEFGLILPSCMPFEARELIDRLREAGPQAAVFSAGLAAWDGAESPPALVRRSDSALYQAKRSAKGRTVVALGGGTFPPEKAAATSAPEQPGPEHGLFDRD